MGNSKSKLIIFFAVKDGETTADVAHQIQGTQGQLHIGGGQDAEVHQQAGAEDAHDGPAA